MPRIFAASKVAGALHDPIRVLLHIFRDVIALAPLVGRDIAYVLQKLHPRHFVLFVSVAIACDSERRMLDLRGDPLIIFALNNCHGPPLSNAHHAHNFLR